jgi:hypothetical protein
MKGRRASQPRSQPVELFVSYSHVNAVWFDRLRPVLKFDRCRDKAFAWNDKEMKAGDRWDKEIREALERMDVFVGLVSFEFLASDYINDVELKRAFAREKKNDIEIVPIVLYPINLERDHPQLNAFNPLPNWGKCWLDYETESGHYQSAHKPIREGLRQAIDKARARKH